MTSRRRNSTGPRWSGGPGGGGGGSGIASVRDGAVRGGLDEPGVLAEDTLGVLRLLGLPPLLAGRPRVIHLHLEQAVRDVERDPVAVPHERDGSAVGGLRRHVPDAQARRTPGESAAGEQ